MFKTWVYKAYQGAYLLTSELMTHRDAYNKMQRDVNGSCMEKIKGIFKGKVIYKYPRAYGK